MMADHADMARPPGSPTWKTTGWPKELHAVKFQAQHDLMSERDNSNKMVVVKYANDIRDMRDFVLELYPNISIATRTRPLLTSGPPGFSTPSASPAVRSVMD